VLLTRLLFCFFAEDTEIFTINQFSHAIESHTKADGTDVADYLNRLFTVLNTSDAKRSNLPDYLAKFPFVNGGLFAKELPAPVFSTKSRKMLIECGSELDWSDINPDIFGSMIQAVVHPEQRGGMGMHYTSVTNIMKVIEPLFLDELYDELENIQFYIDEKLVPSRLRRLKNRLAHIKIFDPTCGSGNFLIIAFKELRKIEMDVIKLLQEIDDEKHQNQDDLFADVGLDSSFSEIKLSQFYGIELDDFAHEVAILSLWLAEHQMNIEFKTEFGDCEPTLPLQKGGNILSGNSVTASWEECCQINRSEEVFIIGNPPYLGSSMQSSEQKSDLANICKELKNYKNLDYIACWFVKAALFIEKNSNAKAAFVSTNSICQGEQIGLLWPYIFSKNVDIDFAHQSFKWANNAKAKAAVICVIVALKNNSQNSKKYLFNETSKWLVSNINPYLTEGSNICLLRRSKPISNIPPMVYGNKATDNGYLFLNKEERDRLLDVNPESHNFIKKLVGSAEFIKGINKWCIWVEDKDYDEAIKTNYRVEENK
jgi:type II restriction/modification system DNA methylase subunit YeeA